MKIKEVYSMLWNLYKYDIRWAILILAKNTHNGLKWSCDILAFIKNFRITFDKYGIHWPEIDEHLSTKTFLKGLSK